MRITDYRQRLDEDYKRVQMVAASAKKDAETSTTRAWAAKLVAQRIGNLRTVMSRHPVLQGVHAIASDAARLGSQQRKPCSTHTMLSNSVLANGWLCRRWLGV